MISCVVKSQEVVSNESSNKKFPTVRILSIDYAFNFFLTADSAKLAAYIGEKDNAAGDFQSLLIIESAKSNKILEFMKNMYFTAVFKSYDNYTEAYEEFDRLLRQIIGSKPGLKYKSEPSYYTKHKFNNYFYHDYGTGINRYNINLYIDESDNKFTPVFRVSYNDFVKTYQYLTDEPDMSEDAENFRSILKARFNKFADIKVPLEEAPDGGLFQSSKCLKGVNICFIYPPAKRGLEGSIENQAHFLATILKDVSTSKAKVVSKELSAFIAQAVGKRYALSVDSKEDKIVFCLKDNIGDPRNEIIQIQVIKPLLDIPQLSKSAVKLKIFAAPL